jgi:hypothetical protein
MAYEHIKTQELLSRAKANFKMYGSYKFRNGGFTGDVVIGDLKKSNGKLTVTYLTVDEIDNGMNYNCVVGHHIKYSDDTILALDDNSKILSGATAFIKTISKMSNMKFNEKKSKENLQVK